LVAEGAKFKPGTQRVACFRLSVSGDDGKSGRGTSGIREKKIEEGALSYIFFQIPLVPRALFRFSPLTDSLEQATQIGIKDASARI